MQSDTAGAAQDRGRTVEELERELAEAHRREAATAEVLRVISRSLTEAKPVFDIIAASALQLVRAQYVTVVLYDGELQHLVALNNSNPDVVEAIRRAFPRRLDDRYSTGRAILSRSTVQIPDVLEDPTYELKGVQQVIGLRSVIAVPMLRDSEPIGAIAVARAQPGLFLDKEVKLLQTFADQAVIAIENARLFEAEQASKRDLQESLEHQTATSEVLNVISRSKFDLQPVLDTLVASAAHLCDAPMVAIHVQRGNSLPGRARHGFSAAMIDELANVDQVMGRGSLAGRTLIDGKPVHICNVENDNEYTFRDFTRITGACSMLGVPLLRDGTPIGLLTLYRTTVDPFTPRQVELMETFADQAVIAIENTRLFEEVQARTRELQDSLQQQTGTAEVLKVISRSTQDLKGVLDTLARSVADLCDSDIALVHRRQDDNYELAASHGLTEEQHAFIVAHPPNRARSSVAGRATLESKLVQITDVLTDPEYTRREQQRLIGFRTLLATPLWSKGEEIGIMTLQRKQQRNFTSEQIALFETFADQAVIAIENARLFEEVQARTRELTESLEYQTATSDVLNVISRSQIRPAAGAGCVAENAARVCGAIDRQSAPRVAVVSCGGVARTATPFR